MRINVTGLKALRAEVKRMREEPASALRADLDRVVEQTEDATRLLVHRDTGALAASVHSSTSMSGGAWRGQVFIGGPGVDYAVYEFARRGHRAYEPAWALGEARLDLALGGRGRVQRERNADEMHTGGPDQGE